MQHDQLDREQVRAYTQSNRRPRRSGLLVRIVGVLFFYLLCSIVLMSCALDTANPLPATLGPTIHQTHTPKASQSTPLPTPLQRSFATHTPIKCLSSDGTVEMHEIQHPGFVSPVQLRVYLPPCYDQDSLATYPTLILLHGLLATDSQWDELGVVELADQLIQDGDAPPFIILMPWIRNSQDPLIAVTEAVIPYARERWRLAEGRQFWAIGGISRGAGQAVYIGLLQPERFKAIGLHSPAFLHTPEFLLTRYLALDAAERPEIWFDIGESDSLLDSATLLLETFDQAGVHIVSQTRPGDHTLDYWRMHLPEYLDWYLSFWLAEG